MRISQRWLEFDVLILLDIEIFGGLKKYKIMNFLAVLGTSLFFFPVLGEFFGHKQSES